MSLHFKDVMLAMGMLKGFASTLGNELVGVVDSVGADVPSSISAGDRVIGAGELVEVEGELGIRLTALEVAPE